MPPGHSLLTKSPSAKSPGSPAAPRPPSSAPHGSVASSERSVPSAPGSAPRISTNDSARLAPPPPARLQTGAESATPPPAPARAKHVSSLPPSTGALASTSSSVAFKSSPKGDGAPRRPPERRATVHGSLSDPSSRAAAAFLDDQTAARASATVYSMSPKPSRPLPGASSSPKLSRPSLDSPSGRPVTGSPSPKRAVTAVRIVLSGMS